MNKILSVSELTQAIKALLEPNFRMISVKGEISNFKLQASGHLYFSLKDAGSQISGVMFRGSAAQLTRMPKEGDQVVATGEISLYAPRGQYQLVVRELQFLGQGELLLKLHQLKEQLAARGWFDSAHKKPLPKFPKTIGVVTSSTGAVIQDILNVLTRRFSGFHVLLNPVKVQGEGAALEIAQAIADFNKYRLADVLIVGRGGGSIEDLWAFNEEIVAKAIYESQIPIISAVGHETDFTIADFVADVRAPTPSAAAEIAIAEKAALLRHLAQMQEALKVRMYHQIRQGKEKLTALHKHPLLSSPYALLSKPMQDTDRMRADLDGTVKRRLEQEKMKLQRIHLLSPFVQIAKVRETLSLYPARFARLMQQILQNKTERLKSLFQHLQSLNPKNVLRKGYSLIFAGDGKTLLHSARGFAPNQPFTALLHDGRVAATATQVEIYDTTLV